MIGMANELTGPAAAPAMLGALDVVLAQTRHGTVPDPGYARCPAHGLVVPVGSGCYAADCGFRALTAVPGAAGGRQGARVAGADAVQVPGRIRSAGGSSAAAAAGMAAGFGCAGVAAGGGRVAVSGMRSGNGAAVVPALSGCA